MHAGKWVDSASIVRGTARTLTWRSRSQSNVSAEGKVGRDGPRKDRKKVEIAHYRALMKFLTSPSDSVFRRSRRDFDEQRETLSGAYAVEALGLSRQ